MCIKVDREERPDLDQIYMNAVQMLTGRGGWPMSVFLTPDLKPFYGGTYWPPTVADGHAGLRPGAVGGGRCLARIAATQAIEQADAIDRAHFADRRGLPQAAASFRVELLDAAGDGTGTSVRSSTMAASAARRNFRIRWTCKLLLRLWQRHRARRPAATWSRSRSTKWRPAASTITWAAAFIATRSTSAGWCRISRKCCTTTPCSTPAYLEAFQATGNAEYARVARETCDYVLRDMTDPAGGFYSTEDADSEGEEGKFYVWTPQEIEAGAGREAAEIFCYVYDVTRAGQLRRAQHSESAQADRDMREAQTARSDRTCKPNWPQIGRSCLKCAANECGPAATIKCWSAGTA